MGKPVVSTTVGAEGLPVDDGVHILLADAPRRFARRGRPAVPEPDRAGTRIGDGGAPPRARALRLGGRRRPSRSRARSGGATAARAATQWRRRSHELELQTGESR